MTFSILMPSWDSKYILICMNHLLKRLFPMGNEGRYHKDLDMRKPDLVAYEQQRRRPGLKVIKLKIKRNDCPQATNHCALFWVWECRASINFQIQEVQTSYLWNLEVPLIYFGSPTFSCDMVAEWRIVKLALKNKHTVNVLKLRTLKNNYFFCCS